MNLSQKAIDEFKEIYMAEFSDEIFDNEAQEMGIRLLRLLDLVRQPLPIDHECDACAREKSQFDMSQ